MSKSGRKMGKKAMKYGAVAAVGALAYNAWQRHQASKASVAVPAGDMTADGHVQDMTRGTESSASELPPPASGFLPPATDTAAMTGLGMTLMRAMIAAARADGRIDPDETRTIFARLEESELSAEEKSVLMNELSRPISVDALAEAVETPQQAMEVYVASLLAIEVDTPAERAYLDLLAARLGLDEELVARLREQVEAV